MKEIVMYGCGSCGDKFMLKHKNEISYCIDNNGIKSFGGKAVFSFEEKKDILKDSYIVVTIENWNVYKAISRELISVGLVEFEDFVWYKYYNKKLAFIWGNCHMHCISDYLSYNKEFNEEYGIIKFQEAYMCENPDEWIHTLNNVDLFISQDIRKENSLGEKHSVGYLEQYLKPDCQKIIVPNLFGMPKFMFPQTYFDDDYMSYEGTMEWYKDRYIDEYVEKNKDCKIDDIVNHIKSKKFEGKLLDDGYHEFMHRLKEREMSCDIKISDFIEENLSKEQLFIDVRHPSVFVLQEMANRIIKFLGYRVNPLYDDLKFEYGHEVPIYDGVKSHFKMNWEQQALKRNNATDKIENIYMDLEEYITQYLCIYK